MPDIDDPFNPPDATVLRPRPGAGRRGGAEATVGARAPLAVARRRFPPPPASPRHRAEPAGAGGQPAAAADRQHARRARRRWTCPACVVTRSTKMRRFEERARAVGRRATRSCWRRAMRCAPASTKRCSRRRGAAQSEWAQHPLLRGAAPRGVGRREVLRDARSHLGRSGAAHRPDGAAVPRAGPRIHRQVPGARARPRTAGRRAAGAVSHDPRRIAARRSRSCRCSGGRSRIAATG